MLLPGQEGFDEALKRWAVNAERKAGVIVLVKSAANVSATASLFGASLIPRLSLQEKTASHSPYVEADILFPVHPLLKEA